MKNESPETIEANASFEIFLNGNLHYSYSFHIDMENIEDVEALNDFLTRADRKKFKIIKSCGSIKVVSVDEESGWLNDQQPETILSLET